MRFFKATISYDGKDFFGWQWQPKHRSVQGEMQDAIKKICGQDVTAIASGRTDAGVHAIAQVVSFSCETKIDAPAWRRALNMHLPRDIFVRDVEDAPFGFHATRDTIRKRYRYVIQDGPTRDLFARPHAWWIRHVLDVAAMHRAAQLLRGTHDFAAFESVGSRRLTTERTILDIAVDRRRIDLSDRVFIEVEADGFLYSMVRNIAGTLAEIGRHKKPEHWPIEILASKDRRQAGMAAPPHGLYLMYAVIDYNGRLTSANLGAELDATE